ncbi:MAG: hypothetical protein FWD16_05675 [Clostridia bacterium]|nr:hypothetical protein [Clostridia bacterium]
MHPKPGAGEQPRLPTLEDFLGKSEGIFSTGEASGQRAIHGKKMTAAAPSMGRAAAEEQPCRSVPANQQRSWQAAPMGVASPPPIR